PNLGGKLSQRVIEAIVQHWQSCNEIFLFDNFDLTTPTFRQQFIEDFWQPLADWAVRHPPTDSRFWLLMFLIDNRKKVKPNQDPFVVGVNDKWTPGCPISLPYLDDKFSFQTLKEWLANDIKKDSQMSSFVTNIGDAATAAQHFLLYSDKPENVL